MADGSKFIPLNLIKEFPQFKNQATSPAGDGVRDVVPNS
jgi:hypothetical protein